MLLEKHISPNPEAKVLVLFGGNPLRRDEMIRHLRVIPDLSIIGTLSEEEGIRVIENLPRVDLILIGGRYTPQQRLSIKNFINQYYPHIKITEPGVEYPYDENLTLQNITQLMK